MPSPLAHAAAGYAIYHVFVSDKGQSSNQKRISRVVLLFIVIGLSLLPDLDFVVGLFFGDYDRFHNTFSNSLITGLVVALVIWAVTFLLRIPRHALWFLLSLLSYELHVVMDFFTWGRGLMLLWPISENRFEPAVYLFYGLHRSAGLVSIHHVWTLLTELVFSLCVILLIRILNRSRNLKLRIIYPEASKPPLEDYPGATPNPRTER